MCVLHVHVHSASSPDPHHIFARPSPDPRHIPSPYLTKVGGDVAIMPAIIISLVAARIAAGTIADPFDDGLMKLHSLPFLEEVAPVHGMCTACAYTCTPHARRMHTICLPQAPPPELNFLTAANAMAEDVVVLPDVCKVRR